MKSPMPPREVVITSVQEHGAHYTLTGTVDGTETFARVNKGELDRLPEVAAKRRLIAEVLARKVPQEHEHLHGRVTV